MTVRQLFAGRQLDPLGVGFLYLLALGLIVGALNRHPADLVTAASYIGAAGLLALPWATNPRHRATAAGTVAFALIGQAYYLLTIGAWALAIVWLALLAGVVHSLSRDQDQSFRQKLNEGPAE